MGHLGARNPEGAIERIKEELKGEDNPETFDPLMAANNMIWAAGLREGGLYLMGRDEKGNEYCPLCEAEKHGGPGTAKNWIEGCTDSLYEHCKQIGLIQIQ